MTDCNLRELVQSLLPEPVSEVDSLQGELLVGGDPGEVVVQFEGEEIVVSVFAVHWHGPHSPEIAPEKFASIGCSEVTKSELTSRLSPLIAKARETRRARFRQCKRCAELNPPEWMHGDSICQSCAERHLGVVY